MPSDPRVRGIRVGLTWGGRQSSRSCRRSECGFREGTSDGPASDLKLRCLIFKSHNFNF